MEIISSHKIEKEKSEIRDLIIKNNLKFYIFNGIFYTVVSNMYKAYGQKFIFRLGGGELYISLFNSLPGLVAVLALLPGVYFISKAKHKTRLISILFLIGRLFVVSFAMVPFLPAHMQPMAFVILMALMFFPESIATNALQSLSADFFPVNDRAHAIANRNKWSTFFSTLSLLILGQTMRVFGATNENAIKVYQIFFLCAFILWIFEIISYTKLKEVEVAQPLAAEGLIQSMKDVFKNKPFVIFLSCSLLFHFGWQMGWPLFGIYQIKYLGADEMWLTILAVTSQLAMVASFTFWQRQISKRGLKTIVAISTFGMALTPIIFMLSPNLYILNVVGIVTGFFTSGCITSILCSTIDASPDKDRMVYMNVHATLTNITLFISPLVGNLFLGLLGIKTALLLTSLFRFIGSFAFFIRRKQRKIV